MPILTTWLRSYGLPAAGAALVALVGTACSGSPSSPSGLSGNANLRIMLTDAPIDDVEKVNIYFTSVTVKPSGKPVERGLTLTLAENPIDLLTLSDKVVEFALGVVEPGSYEFMHINVDASRSSIVEKGVEKPLQVPSEKIKVLGGFTVNEDATTTLTVDFDAKASLRQLGHGGWLLTPLIAITGHNTSSKP